MKDEATDVWEDAGSGICVYVKTAIGQAQAAGIVSYDADGFTMNWIKVGVPAAGTARVSYIAYK